MEPKISKENIQKIYHEYLENGCDDWEARKHTVDEILTQDYTAESEPMPDDEYYFTIYTVWKLCDK